jgi:hypothetical protein
VSASQRRKGHQFEREVARELTECTGIVHKRVLNETRDGNQGDIRPTKASGFPIVVQCKTGARPDVWGAVREAVDAVDGSEFAVAAIHRTGRGGERIMALPWDDGVELLALLAERYRT